MLAKSTSVKVKGIDRVRRAVAFVTSLLFLTSVNPQLASGASSPPVNTGPHPTSVAAPILNGLPANHHSSLPPALVNSLFQFGSGRALDLSSTNGNIPLSTNIFAGTQFVDILVGGNTMRLQPGGFATPGEYVAALQVLKGTGQTLILNGQGAAEGGTFVLNKVVTPSTSQLVIPAGVSGIDVAGRPLILHGSLINNGSLVAISNNPLVRTAVIGARDITNNVGGLITSDLSTLLPPGSLHPIPVLNLTLWALNNINNSGVISSTGSLTVGSLQGAINNSGQMTAGNNLNMIAGTVTNSGLIGAGNNLNISSTVLGTDLNITGIGGTFSALHDINLASTHDINLTGGDYLSENLNISTPSGTVEGHVGSLTGVLNTNVYANHITVATPNLILGHAHAVDPTYMNTTGDITISGTVSAGENIAILAAGNILASGAGHVTTASTSFGNIYMVAGATVSQSGADADASSIPADGSITAGNFVTVNFSSGAGGNIDLTGSSFAGPVINTRPSAANSGAGQVYLAAFAGSNPNTGAVILPASAINASGNGTGMNGFVEILAGGANGSGVAIQTGSINNSGGSGAPANIFISAQQPTGAFSNSVTWNSNGNITAGGGISGTGVYSPGSVSVTGNINSGSSNVSLASGGAITQSSGTTITTGSGGSVDMSSSTADIGTLANPMRMSTPQMFFTANSGSAYLTDTKSGALQIQGSSASNVNVTTATGNLTSSFTIFTNTLTLNSTAGGSFGTAIGTPIATTASTVSANTTGTVFLNTSNNLVQTTVNSSTASTFDLHAGNTINVAGPITAVSSVTLFAGNGLAGGNVVTGGGGGGSAGGSINISAPVTTTFATGVMGLVAGNGGVGGNVTGGAGTGGTAGTGGSININSGGSLTSGFLGVTAGNGGAGGTVQAGAGSGGAAGAGGSINVSNGGSVSATAVTLTAGAGGAGGGNTAGCCAGNSNGGAGGAGGSISVAGTLTGLNNAMTLTAGAGGVGGATSNCCPSTSGAGGAGGSVTLSSTGVISETNGNLGISGGAGGQGGIQNVAGSNGSGNGGFGGNVTLAGEVDVANGNVFVIGGNGGSAANASVAASGSGRAGGNTLLSGTMNISGGNLTMTAGTGGNGGAVTNCCINNATSGSGGTGGSTTVSGTAAIIGGAITLNGGNGGTGGLNGSWTGIAGNGGAGGSVVVSGSGSLSTTSGTVTLTAGNGKNGGGMGSGVSTSGSSQAGNGGAGGSVTIDGAISDLSGSVGASAGSGGNGGGNNSPGTTVSTGAGGSAGNITVGSTGSVSTSGGTLTFSTSTGGNGGQASSGLNASTGSGGSGGSILIQGSAIDSSGAISLATGNGGNGGLNNICCGGITGVGGGGGSISVSGTLKTLVGALTMTTGNGGVGGTSLTNVNCCGTQTSGAGGNGGTITVTGTAASGNGNVSLQMGSGGTGGLASSCCSTETSGNGGSGGGLSVSGILGTDNGAVVVSTGAGGDGGDSSSGIGTAVVGTGGVGGAIVVNAGGKITASGVSLTLNTGSGGTGGTTTNCCANDSAGSGGNGGAITINGTVVNSAGGIALGAGGGGAGGDNNSCCSSISFGGAGGGGGSITVTGLIQTSGGGLSWSAGDGGAAGFTTCCNTAVGGAGGAGGSNSISGTLNIAGGGLAINAGRGGDSGGTSSCCTAEIAGAAGVGGSNIISGSIIDSTSTILITGGAGGDGAGTASHVGSAGGTGGSLTLTATGSISGVSSITLEGGSGGEAGPAAQSTASSGGNGGNVTINGAITDNGGSVVAVGGSGGTGGQIFGIGAAGSGGLGGAPIVGATANISITNGDFVLQGGSGGDGGASSTGAANAANGTNGAVPVFPSASATINITNGSLFLVGGNGGSGGDSNCCGSLPGTGGAGGSFTISSAPSYTGALSLQGGDGGSGGSIGYCCSGNGGAGGAGGTVNVNVSLTRSASLTLIGGSGGTGGTIQCCDQTAGAGGSAGSISLSHPLTLTSGDLTILGGNGGDGGAVAGNCCGNFSQAGAGAAGGAVSISTTISVAGSVSITGGTGGTGGSNNSNGSTLGDNAGNGGVGGDVTLAGSVASTAGPMTITAGTGGTGGAAVNCCGTNPGLGGNGGALTITGSVSNAGGNLSLQSGAGGSGGPAQSCCLQTGGDGGGGGALLIASLATITETGGTLSVTGGTGGVGGSPNNCCGTLASGRGGDGASVTISGTLLNTNGDISIVAGQGGSGGVAGACCGNYTAGAGGNAGSLTIDGSLTTQNGSLTIDGSSGGQGGLVSDCCSTTDVAGRGGDGGLMTLSGTFNVSNGDLSIAGSRGGDGGFVSTCCGGTSTTGGAGGDAGDVLMSGTVSVTTGDFTLNGGSGGVGGYATVGQSTGGAGGKGGDVTVGGTTSIAVAAGSISIFGGNGGAGSDLSVCCSDETAGAGGNGGSVSVDGSLSTTGGGLFIIAGSGGGGGTVNGGSSGNPTAGAGGDGGSTTVNAGGTIDGDVVLRAGNGGTAGSIVNFDFCCGGNIGSAAGGKGGDVTLSGSLTETGGDSLVSAGNGGAGTTLSNNVNAAAGGSTGAGGIGGSALLPGSLVNTSGNVLVSGGNGGAGGDTVSVYNGTYTAADGASGGSVVVAGSVTAQAGILTLTAGNGGAGGSHFGASCCAFNNGSGGASGAVMVSGSATGTGVVLNEGTGGAVGVGGSGGSNGQSGSIDNSGTITATTGNITADSASGIDLVINGGGTMNATSGTITLSATGLGTSNTIDFKGSQTFNGSVVLNAADPLKAILVEDGANVVGHDDVTLNTCTLLLQGTGNISGNPMFFNCGNCAGTIANSSGDVVLNSNLTFNGQHLSILASGNIVATSSITIDLSGPGAIPSGDGGSLSLIAGFNFTPSTGGVQVGPGDNKVYTIDGTPSVTGGRIDVTNALLNTGSAGANGGNILLVAHSGSINDGSIAMGDIVTSAAGRAGDLTVIGPGGISFAPAVFSTIQNGGGSQWGKLTIISGEPTVVGGPINDFAGQITGPGHFEAGSLTPFTLNFSLNPSDNSNGIVVLGGANLTIASGVLVQGQQVVLETNQLVNHGQIDGTSLTITNPLGNLSFAASDGTFNTTNLMLAAKGDIDLTNLNSGNTMYGNGGANVIVVAGHDITVQTGTALSIVTAAAFNSGSLNMVAGADYSLDLSTPGSVALTVSGPSTTGGSIDFANAASVDLETTPGFGVGSINLAAYGGAETTSGRILMPASATLVAGQGGGLFGGSINIFAGAAAGQVSTIGSLETTQPFFAGNVTLSTTQAQVLLPFINGGSSTFSIGDNANGDMAIAGTVTTNTLNVNGGSGTFRGATPGSAFSTKYIDGSALQLVVGVDGSVILNNTGQVTFSGPSNASVLLDVSTTPDSFLNGNVVVSGGNNITGGTIRLSASGSSPAVIMFANITATTVELETSDVGLFGGTVSAETIAVDNANGGVTFSGCCGTWDFSKLMIVTANGVGGTIGLRWLVGGTMTGGGNFVAIASRDILSDAGSGATLRTESLTGDSGSITLIAGADFDYDIKSPNTITVNGANGLGGNINLALGSTVSLVSRSDFGNGGDVTIVAYEDTGHTQGNITLNAIVDTTSNFAGAHGGNITIISTANPSSATNTITTQDLQTQGPTGGSVLLATSDVANSTITLTDGVLDAPVTNGTSISANAGLTVTGLISVSGVGGVGGAGDGGNGGNAGNVTMRIGGDTFVNDVLAFGGGGAGGAGGGVGPVGNGFNGGNGGNGGIVDISVETGTFTASGIINVSGGGGGGGGGGGTDGITAGLGGLGGLGGTSGSIAIVDGYRVFVQNLYAADGGNGGNGSAGNATTTFAGMGGGGGGSLGGGGGGGSSGLSTSSNIQVAGSGGGGWWGGGGGTWSFDTTNAGFAKGGSGGGGNGPGAAGASSNDGGFSATAGGNFLGGIGSAGCCNASFGAGGFAASATNDGADVPGWLVLATPTQNGTITVSTGDLMSINNFVFGGNVTLTANDSTVDFNANVNASGLLSVTADNVSISSSNLIADSVVFNGYTVDGANVTPMTVTSDNGAVIATGGNITVASAGGQDLHLAGCCAPGYWQVSSGKTIAFTATDSSNNHPNIHVDASQLFSANNGAIVFTANGDNAAFIEYAGNLDFSATSNASVVFNTCNLNSVGGSIFLNGNQMFLSCPFENGTIANSSGSIDLAQFGNLTFTGLNLAILAEGNIYNSGGPLTIDLSDHGVGNSGGSLTLLAGFHFTPSTNGQTVGPEHTTTFTITAPSSGSINLSNVSIDLSGDVNGGSVFAVAEGSISLGSINASGGNTAGDQGGTVVLGGRGVTVGSIDTSANSSGFVGIGSGTIGLTGSPTITDGALSGSNFFVLSSTYGDISLSGINAPGGSVAIQTGAAGAVTSSAAITTDSLTIVSGSGGVGTSGSPVTTSATSLTVDSGTAGDVFLATTAANVSLDGSNQGHNFNLTGSSDVTLSAGSSLIGSNAISIKLTGTHALTLSNSSTISADNITLSASSIVNNTTLDAGNLLLNGTGASFNLTGTGSINVCNPCSLTISGASVDLANVLNQVGSGSGLNGVNVLVVSGGNITVGNTGPTSLDTSSTTGDGGSITMVAGATFSLNADNSVTVTGFGANGDIDLTHLTSLSTDSTFASGNGGALFTIAPKVTSFSPTSSITTTGMVNNGNVTIISGAGTGAAITLNDVTTSGAVPSTATNGSVSLAVGAPTIDGSGSITFTNGVKTAGGNLTAGTPSNGAISVGDVNADGGNFSASAGGNVTAANITLGQGTIDVESNGNITITGSTSSHELSLVTNGASGIINLPTGTTTLGPSSGTITVNRDLSGNGGSVTLVGSAFQVNGVATSNLTIDVSGTGTGDGGIAEVGITAATDLTVGSGGLTLLAQSGLLGGSGGIVSVSTNGNLTVTPANLNVTAVNGDGGTIILDAGKNLLVTGGLSANAGGAGDGGLILLVSQSTTAFNLGSTAATNKNGVKGVISAQGAGGGMNGELSVLNSGGGITSSIQTFSGIDVLNLSTVGSTAGNITITKATGGSLTSEINLSAGGAGKVVIAGIGVLLRANEINLSSGTGAITGIVNTPALTVNTLGTVSITDKAAVNLGTSSGGASFSLKVTKLNGGITLSGPLTTNAGTITLTANGSGNIVDAGAGVDAIVGKSITLKTGSGNIGGATPLRISATGTGAKLVLATTGGVNINNLGGAFATSGALLATGDFDLTSSGTVTIGGAISKASNISIFTNNNASAIVNAAIGSTTLTNNLIVDLDGTGSLSGTGLMSAGTSVNLHSDAGSIGSATKTIKVTSPTVTVTAGGVANVTNSRTGASTLLDSSAGTKFTYVAGGALTVNDITVDEGAISVTANTGLLTIANGAQILADSNTASSPATITLMAKSTTNGAIVIGNNSDIETSGTAGRNVNIVIGSVPATPAGEGAANAPDNVNVVETNGGAVFFGAQPDGIIGPGTTPATLTAIGTGAAGSVKLILNTPNVARTITIGDGAIITADPPAGTAVAGAGSVDSVVSNTHSAYVPKVVAPTPMNVASPSSTIGSENAAAAPGVQVTAPTVAFNTNAFMPGAMYAAMMTAAQTRRADDGRFWISDTELNDGQIPAVVDFGGQPAAHGGKAAVTTARGSVVYAPSKDMTVSTAFGEIQIAANAVVLVMSYARGISVFDLHDTRADAVKVIAGGHELALRPGFSVAVTDSSVSEFADVNPAQLILYRNIEKVGINGSLKAFHAEFAPWTTFHSVVPIARILRSTQVQDRRIAEQLLKTAAIVLQTRGSKSKYQQILRPEVAAWNQ